MRSLVLALMFATACTPTYVIVSPDAARSDAPSDAGVDAPAPLEPAAGSECDQQDDCTTCANCSSAPSEYCNGAALACEDAPECLALNDCVARCVDDRACLQRCAATHPEGVAPLVAYITCAVCTACPADCRDRTAVWCVEAPF